MIRALFLITELDRGGAERALYDLVRRLDHCRIAPQVVSLGPPGYYSERLAALGVEVHHLGLSIPRGWWRWTFPFALAGAILRLAKLLKRERVQVLQSFLFHANLVGRIAGALARTPVVLGGVRTAEPRHIHTLLDGLTFPLVRGEVCVSEAVRRFQARRAGLPLRRLFVIPNGVEPSEFSPPAAPFGIGSPDSVAMRRAARQKFGLPPQKRVLAFVGRFCEAKALPDLLAAHSRVLRQEGDAMLVLAGDGPLAPALRRKVQGLKLKERVLMPGWLEEPGRLYAAADCFVLASQTEGMPGALLEAMAWGLPAVTTDAPGCEELVVDGRTGFVAPRGRPQELASLIGRVLANPERSAAMGRAARRRALERFSLRAVVRRYEALYERLLLERR